MKRLLMLGLCCSALVGSSMVFADTENSQSTTTSDSHNPLTGNDTHTKTTTKKVKDPHSTREMKWKEKKTNKANGGSEKSTTTEESESPKD